MTTAQPKRRDAGLGTWLRKLRTEAGLSQVEVARRMGCAPSWISHLESGHHDPKLSTILRYGDAIGAQIRILTKPGPHTEPASKEHP